MSYINLKEIILLGIESSCDETSAAISQNDKMLANVIADQAVHRAYGGVVPELASRAHQKNIVPVVEQAIREAGIDKNDVDAVAFTRGPGLMGALLVGTSFAKAFALGLNVPLIEVNHMQAHVLAHFIKENEDHIVPSFPFLCLTVSGGHTQIVMVRNHLEMQVLGQSLDDAAGEAFDKAAKIIGLPYPGGPLIDRFSKDGDPLAFKFPKPKIPGLDFSFSGLKTSFLYFLNDKVESDPDFLSHQKANICASIQHAIVTILIEKLISTSEKTGIKEVAIAGGVSANSYFRSSLQLTAAQKKWNLFIPKMEYSTDNAAMIAIAGYFKFLKKEFTTQEVSALPRYRF
ncbi:MAG: tRNA (adenosine(37)-N6)-threonylcarbamoyltransferase complex transferase subunit TsaD [Bacteroidia bacterium]